jgi:hypothetical protein
MKLVDPSWGKSGTEPSVSYVVLPVVLPVVLLIRNPSPL